jgi:hypothetical protein
MSHIISFSSNIGKKTKMYLTLIKTHYGDIIIGKNIDLYTFEPWSQLTIYPNFKQKNFGNVHLLNLKIHLKIKVNIDPMIKYKILYN